MAPTKISHAELVSLGLDWFKELLRFDTSNPPGSERPAIEWIATTLKRYGVSVEILGRSPERPNLLAQVGENPTFFLSSHVDVVPAGPQERWKHGPFSGAEADGCIWGRGAVDVKYKAAFDMVALLHATQENRPLQAVFVADEECSTGFGSSYLVKNHRQKLRGTHVLNEVGGFPLSIFGATVYPVQAGEKGARTVKVKLRAHGGHASIPMGQNPIEVVPQFFSQARALFGGAVVTDVTKGFLKGIGEVLPPPFNSAVALLADPATAAAAAQQIPDPVLRAQLTAMLFPLFVPTEISAGAGVNVIPSELNFTADLRFFPSQRDTLGNGAWLKKTFEEMFSKLQVDAEVSVEGDISGYSIPPEDKVLRAVGSVLEKRWKGRSIPFLLPASSDSSMYASVGITPVGFAPLKFSSSFEGFAVAHAPNERVEKEAFTEGLNAYLEAIDLLTSGRY